MAPSTMRISHPSLAAHWQYKNAHFVTGLLRFYGVHGIVRVLHNSRRRKEDPAQCRGTSTQSRFLVEQKRDFVERNVTLLNASTRPKEVMLLPYKVIMFTLHLF